MIAELLRDPGQSLDSWTGLEGSLGVSVELLFVSRILRPQEPPCTEYHPA